MFSFKNIVALVFSVSLVSASATPNREARDLTKRGAVLSGLWDTETQRNGRFILQNNLWGASSASSGWQKSQVKSVHSGGSIIGWNTTYNWVGAPTQVKSYANLDLRVGISKSLASITSMPSKWSWTYSSASSDLVADVAFDLWLSQVANSSGASSTSTFEIMIWLSTRGGAGPAGYQIGTATINGVTWKLFKGTVQNWTIFSFVSPKEIKSFSQDLMPFLTFLIEKQGVSSSQLLVQAQAGTEPFIGSATLTTNYYSLSINSQ